MKIDNRRRNKSSNQWNSHKTASYPHEPTTKTRHKNKDLLIKHNFIFFYGSSINQNERKFSLPFFLSAIASRSRQEIKHARSKSEFTSCEMIWHNARKNVVRGKRERERMRRGLKVNNHELGSCPFKRPVINALVITYFSLILRWLSFRKHFRFRSLKFVWSKNHPLFHFKLFKCF